MMPVSSGKKLDVLSDCRRSAHRSFRALQLVLKLLHVFLRPSQQALGLCSPLPRSQELALYHRHRPCSSKLNSRRLLACHDVRRAQAPGAFRFRRLQIIPLLDSTHNRHNSYDVRRLNCSATLFVPPPPRARRGARRARGAAYDRAYPSTQYD